MSEVLRIVLKRLGLGLVTLLVISVIIFGAVELLPGDIAQAVLGQGATEENVAAIAGFIQEFLPNVERYDLLALNNTCEAKYRRLGREYVLENAELIPSEEMELLAEAARSKGLDFVHWSGMTKRKDVA